MRKHQSKDLRYDVALLKPDGQTVITASVGAGIEDLSGTRLQQAQSQSSETSHMILLHYLDGVVLPHQGYIRVTDPGDGSVTLYVVDYKQDIREPRERMWVEVYCHAERANS